MNSLSAIGTPTVLSPLPGALEPVTVGFDAQPADNKVEWKFYHEGDDLATIVATVTPNGDSKSTVELAYVEGTAPDDRWRNGQARRMIRSDVYRLVAEAVDSTLEGRPYDLAISQDVAASAMMKSTGALFDDVDKSLDDEIARREERDRQDQAESESSTYANTRPSKDLSKYNK
jgi:hypothetical protein